MELYSSPLKKVIVEGADEWLVPLFVLWLISRQSWFQYVWSWKVVRGLCMSMGAFTRVRKIWLAVTIASKLYPASAGPTVFVAAFVQAIATAWGWVVVQRLTGNHGPAPALDWNGFTVISSVVASAALTAVRNDDRLQLGVGAALVSWFLFDVWSKLLLGGAGNPKQPPVKKETAPAATPTKDAKKTATETKKNK